MCVYRTDRSQVGVHPRAVPQHRVRGQGGEQLRRHGHAVVPSGLLQRVDAH